MTDFKFEDFSREVKRQLTAVNKTSLEAALIYIEGQSKSLAAVQSGEMRDKISHNITDNGKTIYGQVGSPFMYALYVEFGTGEFAENGAGRKGGWNYKDSSGEWFFTWGQDPQPFLRPAFRRNRKNIETLIGGHYSAKFGGG